MVLDALEGNKLKLHSCHTCVSYLLSNCSKLTLKPVWCQSYPMEGSVCYALIHSRRRPRIPRMTEKDQQQIGRTLHYPPYKNPNLGLQQIFQTPATTQQSNQRHGSLTVMLNLIGLILCLFFIKTHISITISSYFCQHSHKFPVVQFAISILHTIS